VYLHVVIVSVIICYVYYVRFNGEVELIDDLQTYSDDSLIKLQDRLVRMQWLTFPVDDREGIITNIRWHVGEIQGFCEQWRVISRMKRLAVPEDTEEVADVTGFGAPVHQSTPTKVNTRDDPESELERSASLFSEEDEDDSGSNSVTENESNSIEDVSEVQPAVNVSDHAVAEGNEARRDAAAIPAFEADANHVAMDAVEQAAAEPEAGGDQNAVPVRESLCLIVNIITALTTRDSGIDGGEREGQG
jgi:hypothetical protein